MPEENGLERLRELSARLESDSGGLGPEALANARKAGELAEARYLAGGDPRYPLNGGMFCDLAEDIFGYVREMNALREKVRADSWAGLSSEYFRWSRARRAAATPENPGPTWECLLVQVERDGVRAVALRNLYELAEEGERMQNSAHEYAGRCSRGLSRVFSIWSGGQRAGMGEIVPDGAGARAWRVAQVYGPRNSRPSPEAEAVMELAAREYGGAERRAGPRGEEEREERRA